MADPVTKYVGYKVSVVRWKPQPAGSIQSSDTFASGSWDDEENTLCIWRYPGNEEQPPDPASVIEPVEVCEQRAPGHVCDVRFVDEERLVGAFSSGGVALFRYRAAIQSLGLSQSWEELHRCGGKVRSCTALAVSGPTIVTGGEDGRLHVLRVEEPHPLRTYEKADNATITSLACTLQSEVLSTSSSGQLKIWDLRAAGTEPVKILCVSDQYIGIQSMDRHPHQPHLVVLGRNNGSVCFWDLRQGSQPVSITDAHSAQVWDVKFHPSHPNHLFTCSQDGSLWHWDAATGPPQPHPSAPPSRTPSSHLTSPWLSGAVAQGKVDILNYLPDSYLSVNSLDIESKHLVCGTDSEALFLLPNMTFR